MRFPRVRRRQVNESVIAELLHALTSCLSFGRVPMDFGGAWDALNPLGSILMLPSLSRRRYLPIVRWANNI